MHLTHGYHGNCDLEFAMTFAPNNTQSNKEPLLEVVNLKTWFDTLAGTVRSVDGVSYQVYAGQTLGIVGESGCGKSVTALSILRLVPTPPARHSGQILFHGEDTTDTHVRERQVGFVFQHYALFRHMTVFENVAFGLRVRPKSTRPSVT
jgi:sulfate transport system ATP-binding protein